MRLRHGGGKIGSGNISGGNAASVRGESEQKARENRYCQNFEMRPAIRVDKRIVHDTSFDIRAHGWRFTIVSMRIYCDPHQSNVPFMKWFQLDQLIDQSTFVVDQALSALWAVVPRPWRVALRSKNSAWLKIADTTAGW
jgi:hypothetical protein